MRLRGKRFGRAMLVGAAVFSLSCAHEDPSQSASVRLVQRELRREFNTRYLSVSEVAPDTLVVELRAGRLMRGVSGRLTVTPAERATLARRAVELLAPGAAPETVGISAVVVDIAESRRLGPLVWKGASSRSVHEVATLMRVAPDTSKAAGLVELRSAPVDSVR
jgi:hypothetical protein